MPQREVIVIAVLAVPLVLLAAGAAVGPIIAESYEKPDPAKMRAYRMSLLTDEQVIALHARAVDDSAKHKKLAQEHDKAFWVERNRAITECESNPATKLRDPDHCYPPIPLGMMDGGDQALVETPDALFEYYVMGSCDLVQSVREARQLRCLP